MGKKKNRIISECTKLSLDNPQIEEKNDFFDVELLRPKLITTDKPAENNSPATDYDRL